MESGTGPLTTTTLTIVERYKHAARGNGSTDP